MDAETLTAALPAERRLALAYAPARSRPLWRGLFVLDQRLGAVAAAQREPMLAQIKLAWWREQMAKPATARARGEPVLALLDAWGDAAGDLQPLVDSWELLLGDQSLSSASASQIAEQRSAVCQALAVQLGLPGLAPNIGHAAQGWALADLAALTGAPALAAQHDWAALKLPRDLRPLAVLYGLARRSRGRTALMPGPRAGLRAVRLGILGF